MNGSVRWRASPALFSQSENVPPFSRHDILVVGSVFTNRFCLLLPILCRSVGHYNLKAYRSDEVRPRNLCI